MSLHSRHTDHPAGGPHCLIAPVEPDDAGRRQRATLLIALCAIALATITLNGQIGPNGDDAAYVEFAQGIIGGHGLAWMHFPVPEPSGYRTFTLPLLLLPFERLVPGSYLLYKLVPWLAFIGLALFLRRFGQVRDRALWLLLVLFNPYLIDYTNQILTEIPFLFLSLLLLHGLHRWSRRGGWHWLPLALGLYLLIHLKELGYALLAALPLCALLYRRRRRLLLVFAAVLALLAFDLLVLNLHENIYFSLTRMHNQYDPAAGSVSPAEFAQRCGKRVLEYALNRLPEFFLMPYFHGIDPHRADGTLNPQFIFKAVPGALLTLLLLRGFRRRCRQCCALTEIYVALYALILIAWQSGLPRYLIPLTPLLYGYLFDGMHGVPRRLPWRLAWAAFFILTLATTLQVSYTARTQPLLPHWQAYYAASRWAEEHLPPTAVIACRKPGLTYLLASRHTVEYPLLADSGPLTALVAQYGVTHILVDELMTGGPLANRYLRPALAASGLQPRAVFRAGQHTELVEVQQP